MFGKLKSFIAQEENQLIQKLDLTGKLYEEKKEEFDRRIEELNQMIQQTQS